METIAADDQFIIEYRLLQIYHKKRKSRSSTKPTHPRVHKHVQDSISKRTRIPASANTDAFVEVADKLTDIVDNVPSAQDEVVKDSESDTIQRLVEILKECGDQVNEKIVNDTELLSYLQGLNSYNLFEKLASAFIVRMVPPVKLKEEDNDQKIKIAWTFEMTSRLSALDLQPMNRTMGFGAQYLHQHFAPWILQHGGWANAFSMDEGDEVH